MMTVRVMSRLLFLFLEIKKKDLTKNFKMALLVYTVQQFFQETTSLFSR